MPGYLPISAPGSKDNNAHNPVWKDNIQLFSSARGRGTSEPSWEDMGNGHYNFRFTVGEELFVTFHINHDYYLGSKGYPHIHFLVNQTMLAGQQITWEMGYTIARGHAQGESLLDPETVFLMTYTATGNEVVGDHIILECSDAQAFDLLEPDTLVSSRFQLSSENVAGDIFGILGDLHYLADRDGTVSKSPDFYT